MGSPTELYLPHGPTQLSVNPNNPISFIFLCPRLATGSAGVRVVSFHFFISSDFSNFIVFSPKTIWVLRIVEYSIIPMLEIFEYTLANVVLPEALLEWDSNGVTQIKKLC